MSKFWENKSLKEMSHEEWEALCDRCGRCCLHKFQDEDTNEILFTTVACKLLNIERCECTDYQNRKSIVPDCNILTPDNKEVLSWMPPTCAYRLIFEGKKLENWHPLISKDPMAVKKVELSIANKAISENQLGADEELEDYIIDNFDLF